MKTVWIVVLDQNRHDFYPFAVFSSLEAAQLYADTTPDAMDIQVCTVDHPAGALMREPVSPKRALIHAEDSVVTITGLTIHNA